MKKKNIVTIGGGTGSFMLLSGLKNYPINISAIVSMTDSGGSTGVLRDELGVLPPGDVRQCLVALSDSSVILRKLMNYRFGGGSLRGHSFGNLFLSALEKIEGGFSGGVEEAGKILNVRGEVIPVTEDNVQLYMELKNGKVLDEEKKITTDSSIEKIGVKKYCLKPRAKANPVALKKILEADVIVIGPGNHYSSVMPNLLVEDIAKAIIKSKAKVIYNSNLVNKKGQTEKFHLDDYADAINQALGANRIDFVIYNIKRPNMGLVDRYNKQKEGLVEFRRDDRLSRTYKIVLADLLSAKVPKYSKDDAIAYRRSLIRHDSDKLARVIMTIAEREDGRSLIKEII